MPVKTWHDVPRSYMLSDAYGACSDIGPMAELSCAQFFVHLNVLEVLEDFVLICVWKGQKTT